MNPEAMDALHDLEKMEAQVTCIKVEYGNNCFSTVSIWKFTKFFIRFFFPLVFEKQMLI